MGLRITRHPLRDLTAPESLRLEIPGSASLSEIGLPSSTDLKIVSTDARDSSFSTANLLLTNNRLGSVRPEIGSMKSLRQQASTPLAVRIASLPAIALQRRWVR